MRSNLPCPNCGGFWVAWQVKRFGKSNQDNDQFKYPAAQPFSDQAAMPPWVHGLAAVDDRLFSQFQTRPFC